MDKNLTVGSVSRTLLLFALPILGANFLQAMYGTVDLMIVGLFTDRAQVSAVSTGSMTMQTIASVVTGLTMGSTVQLGHRIGAGDRKGAAHTVMSSLVIFVLTGIILTICVTVMAVPISTVMNAPTEAFSGTVSYIRICGLGIICTVLFNAISGIFRGVGDSTSPFVLMLISCVTNIIGDLLLVGGFRMGSNGAAAATVFAQGFSVLWAVLIFKKKGLGFPIPAGELRVTKEDSVRIIRYGLPIASQELLTGVSFMVILAILNGFGIVASAGVGVAEKICGLMFIVPGAVMSAVSAFSAQNVGAGDLKRARQGMFAGMWASLLVGVIMFLVTFTHGAWLSHFFSTDTEVCLASADYLRSYSVDCIIVSFTFSMMGYLNGHGRTGFVALQGILCTFLVRIPVSYFMSKIPGVSLFQVGFATPLATLFGILLLVIYLIPFERRLSARSSSGKDPDLAVRSKHTER